MHTIRNGVLSYSLMNVPVGVCTAAKRNEKSFKTLHIECGQPISSPKQCTICQKDNLNADELAKGFEFTKRNYVIVDPDVMAAAGRGRTEVISITKCVEWSDLDDLHVERSYYLSPASVLVRPYQLLANALGDRGAIGIGSASLWGKEYPVGVWARESGVLVLSILYCHDEVTPDHEIVEQFGDVPEDEQELANMLVAAMLRPLNPQEDLVSEQRQKVDEYIAALIQGEEFLTPEKGPEPSMTVDVKDALMKSLELARLSS